jgi:hypothetical protein
MYTSSPSVTSGVVNDRADAADGTDAGAEQPVEEQVDVGVGKAVERLRVAQHTHNQRR